LSVAVPNPIQLVQLDPVGSSPERFHLTFSELTKEELINYQTLFDKKVLIEESLKYPSLKESHENALRAERKIEKEQKRGDKLAQNLCKAEDEKKTLSQKLSKEHAEVVQLKKENKTLKRQLEETPNPHVSNKKKKPTKKKKINQRIK
jgi:hypothetical protein